MERIATLTLNPAVDASSTTRHVCPEAKLRCTAPVYDPGGGGVNVSRAVGKLGGTSTALWTRGGSLGQLLEGLLDGEGLTHRPIPVEGMTRQNLTVGERVSEHQYRFTMPGPTLSEAEAERCLRTAAALDPVPGCLVASGSLPPGLAEDFYGQLARTLPAECRLIVDTSGPALRHAVEAGAHLIKPNMRELGELTGLEIADDEQVDAAARDLIERHGVSTVVVSLGAAGAAVVTRQRSERIPSPTVPIRSRVGAGDSMVAGLTLRLAAGGTVEDAARFGVAAGAAAVMTPGTELCRREDAERLYQHMAAEVTGASAGSNA